MRRAALSALVLLLLALIAIGAYGSFGVIADPAPLPAGDGQVRIEQVDVSSFPEVSLFVSVLDEAGQPRAGLGSADFAVTEDGAAVDVADFGGSGEGGPISTALVIDRSGSMEDGGKIDGARQAAAAFVGQLRPGDQAAILPFNSAVEPGAGFSADPAVLQGEIDLLRPFGGTALYDAVVAGVDALRDQPGRRVLLVLADGQDCSAPFPDMCPAEEGSDSSLREAIAYAVDAGQPVYVVGLGDGDDIDEGTLRRIADETGGRYYAAADASQLAGLYADVAGAVQQEYQLTYISPRQFYDGTRRDIQVTVGGATAGTGYTERHLINVVSSPLVGLVLLVPLAGLLALPTLLRRRARAAGGALPAPTAPLASAPPPALAPAAVPPRETVSLAPHDLLVGQGSVDRGSPPQPAPPFCFSCGKELRPGARFCPGCGRAQPEPAPTTAGSRTFCDMCGRPLLPDAKFCTVCGAAVMRRPGRP